MQIERFDKSSKPITLPTTLMKITRFSLFLVVIFFGITFGYSQTSSRSNSVKSVEDDTRHIRSSAAYAELLLRKTELEAELESLLLDYTDEFPKVKDIRIELELLRNESSRLNSIKPAEAQKLTLALGRLMLQKVAHSSTLQRLRLQYKDEHPSVRKQKRIVEVFEAAIKEILN